MHTDVLANVGLKYKLILVLMVPAIVALYFGIGEIIAQCDTVNDNSQLQELVELSTSASAYVHETQKERGARAYSWAATASASRPSSATNAP